MNTRIIKMLSILLLALSTLLPAAYGQNPEAYSAVAMGVGGSVGGKTVQFDFKIDSYTSDEELDTLAQLLKEKGQDSLRQALEKKDIGRINPSGSVGNQLAVARKRQAGADTIITVVTARIIDFPEAFRSGRSMNYPFGFLQVKLNAKGEGSGKIFPAASIRFNKKKGQYEIESYGNAQYIRAVNVRLQK